MEMLLPVSTVISQALPLTVPVTVRLSPTALMDPVLNTQLGALKFLAELRPASPATARFPAGKSPFLPVHDSAA